MTITQGGMNFSLSRDNIINHYENVGASYSAVIKQQTPRCRMGCRQQGKEL